MNLLGLELDSVGNHEFDKGARELLRMQSGGCEKYTSASRARSSRSRARSFHYLAANVVDADGTTLFPGDRDPQFGPVKIGFIGMTLKDTGSIVTPAGVAGLHFADEADDRQRAGPG